MRASRSPWPSRRPVSWSPASTWTRRRCRRSRTADLSYIVSAAESVAANLRSGQLVVLQSTTYPGTTEEIVLPILEASGRRVGRDFFLGYAPERVDPGNKEWTIRKTPKLVSGATEECLLRTEALYETIVDTVVPVSSPM